MSDPIPNPLVAALHDFICDCDCLSADRAHAAFKALEALEAAALPHTGEAGDWEADLDEAATDIVALWLSPKINGLSRAERNDAISTAREALVRAVKKRNGRARSRDVERRVLGYHGHPDDPAIKGWQAAWSSWAAETTTNGIGNVDMKLAFRAGYLARPS